MAFTASTDACVRRPARWPAGSRTRRTPEAGGVAPYSFASPRSAKDSSAVYSSSNRLVAPPTTSTAKRSVSSAIVAASSGVKSLACMGSFRRCVTLRVPSHEATRSRIPRLPLSVASIASSRFARSALVASSPRSAAVYEADRHAGLVSGKRGKPCNQRSAEPVRSVAAHWRSSSSQADFGPTLACEKLAKLHESGSPARRPE